MGFLEDLRKVSDDKEAGSIVPATLLTFGIMASLPTPTDVGYFYGEKWIMGHESELGKNAWLYKAANYYGWDAIYHMSLAAFLIYFGDDFSEKLQIGVGLASTGVIATLLWRFMHPEIKMFENGE